MARNTSERTRYPPQVKQQVKLRYRYCRTTADKQALADELGIGSVPKLYNLASRLGATGDDSDDHYELALADESRLRARERPADTSFSSADDRYLRNEFGRRTIEAIAFHLHHTETAILYRARKLGLRKPAKYWNMRKVASWLGFSESELRELRWEGIDIFQLYDRHGTLALEAVSTTSLARWLNDDDCRARVLVHGADEFFLLELDESITALVGSETTFESCKFLSHGHVCQNSYSDSYGLFCTNNERYKAGEDPRCAMRLLEVSDLRPQGEGQVGW